MNDFSDIIEKNDIVFENTSKFKIRNLLKTYPGEIAYNTFIGIDLSNLLTENITLDAFKQVITKYLFSFNCSISGFENELTKKGIANLIIRTQEEVVNV